MCYCRLWLQTYSDRRLTHYAHCLSKNERAHDNVRQLRRRVCWDYVPVLRWRLSFGEVTDEAMDRGAAFSDAGNSNDKVGRSPKSDDPLHLPTSAAADDCDNGDDKHNNDVTTTEQPSSGNTVIYNFSILASRFICMNTRCNQRYYFLPRLSIARAI